ncbi:MAG: hypothetical protein K9L98_02215 [Candidatus Pacebacteria bacterium]|nr:hypothetical protein [Candidatus Paceibacterota bacterium]MCF7862801.1 hypothetical protein [Candidatus Paceibacterota bacterium]
MKNLKNSLKDYVYFFVCVVFFSLIFPSSSSSYAKKSVAEVEAVTIIERAIDLCDFIPDPNYKQLIISGLQKMVIIETEGEYIEFSDSKKFVLWIRDSELPKLVGNIKVFEFFLEPFEKNACVLVSMNKYIHLLSKDLDAKACILIHEFVHAIQANNRLANNIKANEVSSFLDERQAWDYSVFVYESKNGFFRKDSDCTNFLTINGVDPFVQNFQFFRNCGDEFLKTMYKDDR